MSPPQNAKAWSPAWATSCAWRIWQKPYASLELTKHGTDADNIKARLKSAPTSFSTEAPKSDKRCAFKTERRLIWPKCELGGSERTFGKDSGQQTVFNPEWMRVLIREAQNPVIDEGFYVYVI